MSRLLDIDNFTGIREDFHKDPITGKITIHKSQNTSELLDLNLAEQDVSNSWKGDMHKVASIPLIIIEMWREELIAKGATNPNPLHKDNKAFFIAKINSGDWSKLRTKRGRI